MKRMLRKGDKSDLNVYTVRYLYLALQEENCVLTQPSFSRVKEEDKNLLGYATWPADYEKKPFNDGVVLRCDHL